MTCIKRKIITIVCLLMIGLGVKAQSFSYTYIDPCTKEIKSITVSSMNGNLPIVMNYYGQVKTFTPAELQNGSFESSETRIPKAIGKSNPLPFLGRSAGARLTVILRQGNSN